eukprot:UN07829
MMSSLGILRLLCGCHQVSVRNMSYRQSKILLLSYRQYEGKPFDQRNKNWMEEQEKNRDYDIDQNIYDFRRKEELKMKNNFFQNKQSKIYQKHRQKMEREYRINEQWRQQRETQRAKDNNVHNFSFYVTDADMKQSSTNSGNSNTMKYALIGGAGAVAIGCLLLAAK